LLHKDWRSWASELKPRWKAGGPEALAPVVTALGKTLNWLLREVVAGYEQLTVARHRCLRIKCQGLSNGLQFTAHLRAREPRRDLATASCIGNRFMSLLSEHKSVGGGVHGRSPGSVREH
jgi:hypothetical protein